MYRPGQGRSVRAGAPRPPGSALCRGVPPRRLARTGRRRSGARGGGAMKRWGGAGSATPFFVCAVQEFLGARVGPRPRFAVAWWCSLVNAPNTHSQSVNSATSFVPVSHPTARPYIPTAPPCERARALPAPPQHSGSRHAPRASRSQRRVVAPRTVLHRAGSLLRLLARQTASGGPAAGVFAEAAPQAAPRLPRRGDARCGCHAASEAAADPRAVARGRRRQQCRPPRPRA